MINVFELKPGQWLELLDGRKVEVAENMEDGMWVGIDSGEEDNELIHAQDIKALAENP